MLTSEQFFHHLRSALNHLYDPYFLRKSPLVKVFELGDQPDTPSVLQHILNEAIAGMEPPAGDASQAQQRRNFELIMYRYVQQFNQEEVANQLGLSVRHLRREQNTAIYDLAARLWNQYHLGTKPFQISLQELEDSPAAAETAPAPSEDSAVNDLSWLDRSAGFNPAQLAQVIPAVLELGRPLAARYAVELRAELANGLPPLAIQEVALRQLLLNVISVGVRWRSGSALTLRAEPGVEMAIIRLSCSELAHAPRALNADEQSSIALARQIAAAYGGDLLSGLGPECFQLEIRLPVYRQRVVMVIDDNLDFVQLIERYLTGTRYTAVSERSPLHALEAAEQNRPDVILLDVMMPQMDGWEVLGRLRRHPASAAIPVIVCSVVPQKELALALGAADFIRKPVPQAALLAALDQILAAGLPG